VNVREGGAEDEKMFGQSVTREDRIRVKYRRDSIPAEVVINQ
jgi:hypothetical protein